MNIKLSVMLQNASKWKHYMKQIARVLGTTTKTSQKSLENMQTKGG
jgi:hypothetical protein